MGRHLPKEKKAVAKFANVKSEDGWGLSLNPSTKRFDLKRKDELILSDVSVNPCIARAAEHNVVWEVEPKLEWVME